MYNHVCHSKRLEKKGNAKAFGQHCRTRTCVSPRAPSGYVDIICRVLPSQNGNIRTVTPTSGQRQRQRAKAPSSRELASFQVGTSPKPIRNFC
jgi:hypothetical protein